MTTKQIGLLVFIIILCVLLLITWVIAAKAPGLFMNLRKNRYNWLKEEIGRPFLTKQQLCDVGEKLATMKVRKLGSVLSTIGTAAYIDGGLFYSSKAKETNKLLAANFPTVYEKLLVHLEKRLPSHEEQLVKCQYATAHDIALPGFHIFPGKSVLGRGWAVASLHVDLQELLVPWPKGYEFDMSKTYSFTIPISVTRDSGLYIFKKKVSRLNQCIPLCISLRNTPRQKIYYKNGDCYLHHGKWLHLISPFKGKQLDGSYSPRITMQGHAIYCITTRSYWIYW